MSRVVATGLWPVRSTVILSRDQERPQHRGYSNSIGDTAVCDENPIAVFQSWFAEAAESGIEEPSAMTVATVDINGQPDARMMLLKGVDEHGFVFYTNLGSAKAQAVMHDPRVALCFYWAETGKQVRVRGSANIVSNEEADAYFATRPRLSQISAWASKQSQPMHAYFELESEVAKTAFRFGLRKIPRPPFWSGFRVVPERIEFWIQKPFRRHQRVVYERGSEGWRKQWLYP
jgi:pyridoxamine 5'-phosphate oxidase